MKSALIAAVSVLALVLVTWTTTPAAIAASCTRQTAIEIMARGDVAAVGNVESFVPLGFIFAAERVYKGDLPAHVLITGQYRPTPGQQFVVLRSVLPGAYSMDICDGRAASDPRQGELGEGRRPSPDLPVGSVLLAAFLILMLIGLWSRSRRRRGPPPTAAASAF